MTILKIPSGYLTYHHLKVNHQTTSIYKWAIYHGYVKKQSVDYFKDLNHILNIGGDGIPKPMSTNVIISMLCFFNGKIM